MKSSSRPGRTWFAPVALAVVAAIALIGAGCDKNEIPANPFDDEASATGAGTDEAAFATGPFADLTIEEIDSAVGLSTEQREPMRAALGRARAAHRERAGRWGRFHPGRGIHGGRFGGPADGERPMIVFLEEASKILNGEQFVELAGLLTDRIDRWAATIGPADGPGMGGRHGRGPGRAFEQIGRRIADYLDLADAQREEVRGILQESFERTLAIRDQLRSGSINREQARDRIREIRTGTRDSVRGVLTEEQWEKAEALRLERIGERVDRRMEKMDRHLDRRASFLDRVLDLTDEQVQQVEDLLEASIPARKEILSQVKAGALPPEGAFLQVRELEKELADAIGALLTPEQLARWEALRDLVPPHWRG